VYQGIGNRSEQGRNLFHVHSFHTKVKKKKTPNRKKPYLAVLRNFSSPYLSQVPAPHGSIRKMSAAQSFKSKPTSTSHHIASALPPIVHVVGVENLAYP
jgi:hypothetical protein